jgi:probable phosphoglycerate mutase
MARQVGDTLADIPIEAIYSSPLRRASETAEIVKTSLQESQGKTLPLEISQNLIEVDLPLWENLPRDEVMAKYPQQYECWKQRPQELKMADPRRENPQEFFPVLSLYEQAKRFWSLLLERHQRETVLVVAHNGINRCLLMSALGIDPRYYHSIQQSNCCINVVNFSGGWGSKAQLESLNLLAHQGKNFPEPRDPNSGLRLLLVRHGETQWNQEGRFQGQIDVPLNENGRHQAYQAAQFLQDVSLDAAISSPMLRPKETAEIILQEHSGVALELMEGLREISHGLWEGKLEAEIWDSYSELLNSWKVAPETVQMPEGENLQQVWDRSQVALEEIVRKHYDPSQYRTVMVVAHDAINKAILCHLFGLGAQNFWTFKQGNGSVSVIDYPQGLDAYPQLQAANITTHLGGGVFDSTAAGAL